MLQSYILIKFEVYIVINCIFLRKNYAFIRGLYLLLQITIMFITNEFMKFSWGLYSFIIFIYLFIYSFIYLFIYLLESYVIRLFVSNMLIILISLIKRTHYYCIPPNYLFLWDFLCLLHKIYILHILLCFVNIRFTTLLKNQVEGIFRALLSCLHLYANCWFSWDILSLTKSLPENFRLLSFFVINNSNMQHNINSILDTY